MIYLGLDIGQAADYTALAADDLTMEQTGFDPSGELAYDLIHRIRHVERYPLGMSYPDMANRVIKTVETPQLRDCRLVVDATGVGRPVVDLLRGSKVHIIPVVITGGLVEKFDADTGFWYIPKRLLVSTVQVVLGHGRLRFAKLPESETIKREFQNFKLKITKAANDTYEAWRDGDHDDLVLSVALAVYFGERHREPPKKATKTEHPMVRLARAGVV